MRDKAPSLVLGVGVLSLLQLPLEMVLESPVLCCYWLWRGFGRSRVFACSVLDVQSTAEVW